MKSFLIYIFAFLGNCIYSQNITLSEVVKIHENTDKVFYKIDSSQISKSIYLGKIEVQGFSANDVDVFNQIYKKAKTTGANSYILSSPKTIDGKMIFNPANYFLSLYYTPAENFPKQTNVIYIISEKPCVFRINKEKIHLDSRSYYMFNLLPNEITDISTRKFLGSRIKLKAQENQATQYFQIIGPKIKSNVYGSNGINFKTGDIIKLEKSYAEFLINIYKRY